MKLLIVADKNGVGHVKPFQGMGSHRGESYWIAGEKFNVSADNRIKLGKKFMEKHGFIRADGRRAVIIETGARHYAEGELTAEQIKKLGAKEKNGKYLVQGGKLKKGKPFEPYYEKNNGSRIPADVGTGDAALQTDTLQAFDHRDIYGSSVQATRIYYEDEIQYQEI